MSSGGGGRVDTHEGPQIGRPPMGGGGGNGLEAGEFHFDYVVLESPGDTQAEP